MFKRLEQNKEGAFVPYVTLGDPNPDLSCEIIETLIKAGADAVELGIPFSDPLADGPVIQASAIRALQTGATPDRCFDILTRLRIRHPHIPVGLLMYANLVFTNGISNFYKRCAQAGVDSVLIGDVPVEESKEFREAAENCGISTVFFAPPNADMATLEQVSTYGGGYTYLLSRAGVTSIENKAGHPLPHIPEALRHFNAPPAMSGFGISMPAQVRDVMKSRIAGVISGSAVVKIIERNIDTPDAMLAELYSFVTSMKEATRNR
ncbi:tryptophan synthase subunit alpha [Erwiniaceae bacterium L1_54_6]|nr:tryptophan synthase subunit alpha [Erwiniaceae bacterium L1_54_6]